MLETQYLDSGKSDAAPFWTEEDIARFYTARVAYRRSNGSNDYRAISKYVGTQSPEDCKRFHEYLRRSERKKGKPSRSRLVWTKPEVNSFLKHLKIHGNNWGKIASCLGTKSAAAVYKYYQSHKNELSLDEIVGTREVTAQLSPEAPSTEVGSTPTSAEPLTQSDVFDESVRMLSKTSLESKRSHVCKHRSLPSSYS